MKKRDYRYWAKFYCPKCHHCFRVKRQKGESEVIMLAEGLPFENHVHCPRCEEYISVKDRIK